MGRPNNKRIKFTDDNVDEYERQFRLEHDIAMGYVARSTPPVQNIMQQAMEVFRPPPSIVPIMESFRSWIRRNQLARFDCFQQPSYECPCYKCETWRCSKDAEIDLMESIMEEKNRDAILGNPNSSDGENNNERKPAGTTENESAMFCVRYACVCHFYYDLPNDDGETPSTPRFSTVEYDLPASDHGKQKAQEKWISLMQMTPTRLIF